MAEAFLQIAIDNLSSLIKEEIGLMMGVDKEMKKLSCSLTTIQAVVEDAEDKQIESKPIRDWLRKLNTLAYEVDDILDDCATHFSKVNHSSRYSPKNILFRHKVARRIKDVNEKLDSVAADRAKFHLREMSVEMPRAAAAARETGSLLKESDKIYGREEDGERIVKMLVDDVRAKEEMSVNILPIIGIGGLGKTTLARLVFNDPRVVEHFEKRLWVCVSDDFEMKTLLKAMIESATGSGSASDLQHLDALERCLWELLSQKRYLLVLDDVWNDHQEKWFELREILSSAGSTGSSVIVTTRLRKVAEIMGTLPPHCLKGLSEEHCWMMLRQRAFGQEEDDVFPNLEVIGKQIVKKCGGVPLAAKALGGILRFKRREEEWIHVKESDTWSLTHEETLILPALRLSYHHLPMELRQCFAYFAAFPKDYKIERKELIFLWMAHGYISAKGNLQVEDVGNEICNELVLRSLLQHTSYIYGKKDDDISMHDLVHDLAQSVMENRVPGMQIERNIHSAATIRQVNLLNRSVCFPKSFEQDIDISSTISKLRSLRVLDASATEIKDLPRAIGDLKHLRYLNLSQSEIRTLPNSVCTLLNLQILKLDYCKRLVALPKNIRYLHNLRHLCLTNCESLSEMPSRIGELTRLRTLSMFVVGLKRGNQLEELQYLDLSGSLEIGHLERVKDHTDAKKANIVEKKNLRELILSWERNTTLSKEGEDHHHVDEKVLEALEPHPNLETLSIRGFSGRYFPVWMTNSTLRKIVEVDIKNCQNCSVLPKLGELPHLKRLRLENLAVEYIIEDDGELVESGNPLKIQFLALDSLFLFDLPHLKGLSKESQNKEVFPNLTLLRTDRCPSLTLPPLLALQKLEDLRCSSSTLALCSEQDALTTLNVEVDKSMACFPLETLAKFRNLNMLVIRCAQEISVPGEGLRLRGLNKLHHLSMEDCETLTCFPQGLLRHLTSLEGLYIRRCPRIVHLPEEIKHLKNLECVQLFGLDQMVRLPGALQHLSSLRRLFLSRLPQLQSLPDWLDQLTSLHSLYVVHCAKVVSLPPAIQKMPNLKDLHVTGCPELESKCHRGTGEEWHKIAHIPRLRIG